MGTTENSQAATRRSRIAVGLVLLLTALVYAPSLTHGFTNWDDPLYYTENSRLAAALEADILTGLGAAFDPGPALRGEAVDWLPVREALVFTAARIFGLSGPTIHGLALLGHLLATALVFFLGRRLFGGIWAPALAAAYFGLQPVNAENVAWAAAAKACLGAAFTLGALLAYLAAIERPEHRRRGLTLAVLLALGAVGSSPFGLVIGPAVILLDVSRAASWRAAPTWRWVPYLVVFALAVALHGGIRTHTGVYDVWLGGSFLGTLGLTLKGIPTYLLNLVLPVALCPRHQVAAVQGAFDPVLWTGVGIVGVTAAVGVYALVRRGPLLFLLGFALVALAPTLNLLPTQIIIADRYLYLPSAAVGLGLAALGRRWWADASAGARRISAVAASAMLLTYAGLTLGYQGTWRSSESLWNTTLECSPNFFGAHHQLGQVHFSRGELAPALARFRRAVELQPSLPFLRVSLGNALHASGRLDGAAAAYRTALSMDPEPRVAAQAHSGLGLCALGWGDPDAARNAFDHALELVPGDPVFRRNRARVDSGP